MPVTFARLDAMMRIVVQTTEDDSADGSDPVDARTRQTERMPEQRPDRAVQDRDDRQT